MRNRRKIDQGQSNVRRRKQVMEARAIGTGLSRGVQTGWREACRGAKQVYRGRENGKGELERC